MLSIINGKWSFGIGDPTVIGWIIFAAYIIATFLCGRCAYTAKKKQHKKQLTFWLTITIILALLAVNKQLDMQTLLTDIARNIARRQGWYDRRQGFQILVSSAIAVIGLYLIVLAGCKMHKEKFPLLTFAGLILLLTFIVIRASSLHSVDQIMAIKIAGLKLRYLLELAAITSISVSAAVSAKIQNTESIPEKNNI